jgi:hypothetical protein
VKGSFSTLVQNAPGAHPAPIQGADTFQGVKRQRRGTDHPPLFSAEFNNGESYKVTALLCFDWRVKRGHLSIRHTEIRLEPRAVVVKYAACYCEDLYL